MGNESAQESTELTMEAEVEAITNAIFPEDASDDTSSPDGVDDLDDGHPKSDESQMEDPDKETPANEAGETGKTQDQVQVDGAPKVEDAEGDEAAREAAELEKQATAEYNALLGIENAEALSNEDLVQRNLQKDRYITELNQRQATESAALEKALKDAGRKIIDTRQGKKIVMSDDAKPITADDVDLSGVLTNLSDTEQAYLVEAGIDARALVGKLALNVANQFASQVTPVSGNSNEEILSKYKQDETYYAFKAEKMGNGKPMYPDLDNDIVKSAFNDALNATDPVMVHMREQAQKSEAACHALWQFVYGRVARACQPKLAAAAAAKRQLTKQTEANKQAATVEGSGGGGGTNQQGQGGKTASKSIAESLADEIAGGEEAFSLD